MIHNPHLDPSTATQGLSETATRVHTGKKSVVPTGNGATAVSSDQARLGASAVGLTAQAMAQPEVRSELVQHFRAQIASGQYVVDASRVADAMLTDPQAGLGNKGNG
ncbi:MAG TPA: flagellar biosynthesis anti-sigma factor FlgM [Terriglobales bacterium]|jgi:flagellar biosynthesis anti-sigma factor FlgM